ncbi:hypothetical protein R3P38DRAFT_2840006 [Favolaschia claudopus]|uniref:Carboxymuconolactone decarboxylase-like domain-containing protein n=1 Tax=Favolaschia claudopus TaxID=2862362 RepID=A0AAW0DZX1_9AGAR
MSSSKRPNEQAHQELYEAGMVLRRKVMGDEYVDDQLRKGTGLEPKQRSLINIALLASQGKAEELAGTSINNGASESEIAETLLQAAIYCGIPTGMGSFRVAEEALRKCVKGRSWAALGTLVSLMAFLFDMVLFGIARRQFHQQGFSSQYGNACWLTLGALVAILLGFFFASSTIFSKYCNKRRNKPIGI